MFLKYFICTLFLISIFILDGETRVVKIRFKRDIPPENSTAVQIQDPQLTRGFISDVTGSIITTTLELIKSTFQAIAEPFIKATRDFTLKFIDSIINSLTLFTKKTEPPFLLSTITAHSLNSIIKSAIEFLGYLRETIRFFFNMFISGSNNRSIRSIGLDINSFLKNIVVLILNIVQKSTINFPFLYPFLAQFQEYLWALIDQFFPTF